MSDDDGPNKKNKYGPPVLSKKINKFNNHGIIFGKIKKKKVRFFFFMLRLITSGMEFADPYIYPLKGIETWMRYFRIFCGID